MTAYPALLEDACREYDAWIERQGMVAYGREPLGGTVRTCKYGHPATKDNKVRWPNGVLYCFACSSRRNEAKKLDRMRKRVLAGARPVSCPKCSGGRWRGAGKHTEGNMTRRVECLDCSYVWRTSATAATI